MQSRQLAASYHLHSCRAAQQSAQLHDAHSNFKSLLCAVPSVEGSKKAAISLLTYAQQTTGCTVPPNYHQRIVICKMSLAHAKPLHVSITATTNGCRKCLCCHQSLPSMQWAVALHSEAKLFGASYAATSSSRVLSYLHTSVLKVSSKTCANLCEAKFF